MPAVAGDTGPITEAQPPGGPGTPGAIIPDAGVYGAGVNAATNAYNNAVAQALTQRNSLYNQYGLNNSGSVDPNNPYGQYQQMLGAQGSQYTADAQNAAARGLGLGGLAHQQESADRSANAAQNWNFQNQVAGTQTNYENTLQNALNTQQTSIADAYQQALQVALQNMLAEMQAGVYNAPKKGGS